MSRVGVDIGGTFTDFVAVTDRGLEVRKTLSTPRRPSDALWALVDRHASEVETLVHGTTIATNALLERRGARTVLCTTAGFEDVLWLRRQERADLYDLAAQHPHPLLGRECVVGVTERMGPDGPVTALAVEETERVVEAVAALDPEAVAISLLFAFRHPQHEATLARAIADRLPDVPVAASSDVVPLFREYERTATTTAEAYLRPMITRYVRGLARAAPSHSVAAVRVMASGGGTLLPAHASGHATGLALSGPAGGVVGAQAVAQTVGRPDVLTIDMGGTSADASLLLRGEPLRETSGTVGGVPLLLSTISIHTVSAGGGSIAWVDQGGALKVGPRSAGASPGPACYGLGGDEPTVTDALAVLGWLDVEHPLASDIRIDPERAHIVIQRLAESAGLAPDRTAWGVINVAAAAMARSLKHVSVRTGIDPRGMALLPFGGAGPLFGCLLAEELGITSVIVPPHPGVLSALGLSAAPERVDTAVSVHRAPEDVSSDELDALRASLTERLHEDLPGARVRFLADCRYAGQGYEVTVEAEGDPASVTSRFVEAHHQRYGHGDGSRAVELVALRAVGEREGVGFRLAAEPMVEACPRRVVMGWRDGELEAVRYPLEGLQTGTVLTGPTLLDGIDATALIAPGWEATVHDCGALLVNRS